MKFLFLGTVLTTECCFHLEGSKCGMSRRGFAFTGVVAAGLPVMGSSLAAQPVQGLVHVFFAIFPAFREKGFGLGVERLEFKPEGTIFGHGGVAKYIM